MPEKDYHKRGPFTAYDTKYITEEKEFIKPFPPTTTTQLTLNHNDTTTQRPPTNHNDTTIF